MQHPEMRQTVFGEVFAELLKARGVEVTPFKVGKLAEDAGLDGVAEALDLSESEKDELAFAFAYERRAGKIGAEEQHA